MQKNYSIYKYYIKNRLVKKMNLNEFPPKSFKLRIMNENVQKLKKLEIDRSGNGFLTNFNQWNIEVGEMIAKEHNINLTNTHWDIISWIQELYKAKKEVTIEAIIKTEIVNTNELFDLFTDDAILVSTKIAGLPCLTKLKKTA